MTTVKNIVKHRNKIKQKSVIKQIKNKGNDIATFRINLYRRMLCDRPYVWREGRQPMSEICVLDWST